MIIIDGSEHSHGLLFAPCSSEGGKIGETRRRFFNALAVRDKGEKKAYVADRLQPWELLIRTAKSSAMDTTLSL